MPAPEIDPHGVDLSYVDRGGDLVAVSLVQEVAWPRSGPDLDPAGDGCWQVRFARPGVDRFEYLFELTHADGGGELVCDPDNPLRAPGAFGDKSVVEFPGYRRPSWLSADPPRGETREVGLPSAALGHDQPALLWGAAGTTWDEPLPLLVALDGFEYDRFSGLRQLLDAMVAEGRLPPMRAVLLQPTHRDDHYSANPAFASALAGELLPEVHRVAPIPPGRRFRVGLGASLGGLALLHCHRVQPASLGGLFLQSGSFFHHRYDRYELGFEYFERIKRFMDRTVAARTWDAPAPVVVTCGQVEQNFRNNRAVALALRAQGYPVRMVKLRDAHNWVGWRDAWTPHLVALLSEVWS